jgi:HK97 family phage major capsid protein
MTTRDALVADLNKATETLSSIRTAETADASEMTDAIVRVDAIRSEIAAFDAAAPAHIPAAPATASESFGRSAADRIVAAPLGTEVKLSRTLFSDPFANGNGEQDATFTQNAGVVTNPDQPLRFIDILPVAPATSDSVTYIKESGFENAAAARVTGDSTPESHLSVEKVVEPVANVAHRIKAAEETLSDSTSLGALIDRRGVRGVRAALNAQLVAAANTPNGVKSVVAAGTFVGRSGTLINHILGEKLELIELGFNPTHVVVSPARFEEIVTAATVAGYVGNGPFGAGNSSVWQLPMVIESGLPADVDAVVLDASAATLYVRDESSVKTDTDINTGVVTIRVQTRAQVAIEFPEAVRVLGATPAGSDD